jgi:hypothetical protein
MSRSLNRLNYTSPHPNPLFGVGEGTTIFESVMLCMSDRRYMFENKKRDA